MPVTLEPSLKTLLTLNYLLQIQPHSEGQGLRPYTYEFVRHKWATKRKKYMMYKLCLHKIPPTDPSAS